jgi:hypothetical protein
VASKLLFFFAGGSYAQSKTKDGIYKGRSIMRMEGQGWLRVVGLITT